MVKFVVRTTLKLTAVPPGYSLGLYLLRNLQDIFLVNLQHVGFM